MSDSTFIANLSVCFHWVFEGELFLKKVTLTQSIASTCSVEVDHSSYYAQCLDRSISWLALYMQGKNPEPLPVRLPDSPFQKSVLKELLSIPFGQSVSYSVLAKAVALQINREPAVRACASVCAKNCYPLVIPCHRVIGKNGSLCGYNQGIAVKKALLAFENNDYTFVEKRF